MDKKRLDEIKGITSAATPGPWTAAGNLPFYVDLRKPAPSLSKHDKECPTYWKVADAEFVLMARSVVPELIAEIERLKLLIGVSL